MGFGCFVASLLWLAVGSILLGSLVPIGIGVVMVVALWVHRGLESEWPLY